jgi:[methyl-Co(III) methanol-specific corrinoid protein]:coenzyme M methyltransferase
MALIDHRRPDRMPCFGANSTATYGQMERAGAFWPEAHYEAEPMARLAAAAHTVLGFDAVRVPFCQTMEAEALGCTLKPGGKEGIPGIEPISPHTIDDTPVFPEDFLSRGRIPQLLAAVALLKKEVGARVPVVAGIQGAFSIAGALLETVNLLKISFKTPEKMHPFLDVAEKAGTALAKALVDAGADIIACEDMASSPALLTPGTYRDVVLDYQRRQFSQIDVPRILHICGKVDLIVEWMGATGADILSIEPKASARLARERCGPDVILMGGADTATTLFLADPETVRRECRRLVAEGIQILAPGCAVAPGTPLANLLAMAAVAREG